MILLLELMQRCLVCHKRHADGVPFVELYYKDRQPRTTRAADPVTKFFAPLSNSCSNPRRRSP